MRSTGFVATVLVASLSFCAASAVNASESVQVGFSPEGSARALVINAINSAQATIDMMAYTFSSADIVQALVMAEKRGVRVRAVIDYRRNQNRASKKAVAYAFANGVNIRQDNHYHIQHDKMMIVDGETLETGSFNFAASAEFENSENVLIIKGNPQLLARYQAHFNSRWLIAKN